MSVDFDCLIIGGGMVGAGLAQALGGQDIRVGLVEAFAGGGQTPPSYDDRGLVMAPASRRILEGLGLWAGLAEQAIAIQHVHVSDRGHFGFTRLSAADMGLDALGHVVVARVLGGVMRDGLKAYPGIEFIRPAKPSAIDLHAEHVTVMLETEQAGPREVTARLLVVADGGDSQVRESLGIGAERHDYGQTAVVATVTPELPHQYTAFERFTSTGPTALLPMSEQRCVAVWTQTTDAAEAVMEMDDDDYAQGLAERVGYRLGKFVRVGTRRAYPIRLITAKKQLGKRFIIIGNAAHTIHPNAAQGLNLGLRDVATLAERVCDAMREGLDPGGEALLRAYVEARRRDQRQVIRFTDGLARLFYNDLPMAIGARGLAMIACDLLPPLKHALMRRAMGLNGRQPRLVCGLPL